MGLICSKPLRSRDAHSPSAARHFTNSSSTKMGHPPEAPPHPRDYRAGHARDMAAAQRAIGVQDADIADLAPALKSDAWRAITDAAAGSATPDEYFASRKAVLQRERALDFDFSCRVRAGPLERRVDAILQALKRRDGRLVYDGAEARTGYGGQAHRRFAGDHFLSNVGLINRTGLLDVARRMPKGAHLHIHFNSCLQPNVLVDIAKGMDRMFITSDLPLVSDRDCHNFERCEIQFSIMRPENERPGNLFSPEYEKRQTMRFADFLHQFSQHYTRATADEWLAEKLVFQESEAHDIPQTSQGAWEKFNGRTRMMKGLFNYETAYRRYTRLFLEDLMTDNIQYAEIRPNFMLSNQLFRDDGSGTINNEGIIKLIINEVQKFQTEMYKEGRFFGGLKVIYCTPRSFTPEKVEIALEECIRFKQQWPEWIAGFDLLGEEAAGNPIKHFIPQLLAFRQKCAALNLDIPFLFHCGETLDMGTDTDGNLVDALLLNSRRIGHGFALAKHPYIMQHMKARGVCLELCPISNEILGLTPRVSGHAMYQLLANGVHCTVSSDNGTLFQSTLSHDFYQVMVGKADMGLSGWKQLILWSLEHSCLSESEKETMLRQWEVLWERFLQEVIDVYGGVENEPA